MPRAYPHSLLVWARPAAEPALSGGADPTTRLVPRLTSGAPPRLARTNPRIGTARPAEGSAWARTSRPSGRDSEAAGKQDRRSPVSGEDGSDLEPDHGRRHPGRHREPCLERRESADELEVLGDEHHRAAGQQRVGQHCAQRNAETAIGEQLQVEQRVRQPDLPPHEYDRKGDAGEERQQRQQVQAVPGDLLEPVDDRQQGGQRNRDARRIEPAGRRVAVLGQQQRTQDEQQHHRGYAEKQHRSPPETLEHCAADERADDRADGKATDPDSDRGGPLPRVAEQVHDQGQCGRCQRGAGDAEERACRNERRGARGVRGEDRRGAERRRTAQQEPPAADAVSQRAGGDEQAGDQEAVDIHDPQLLSAGGTEVRGQVWQREQHDEGVERDEKRRQGQHGEANPLPPAGANGCRRVVAMHVFPLSMTNPQNPARGGRRFVDGRAPLSAGAIVSFVFFGVLGPVAAWTDGGTPVSVPGVKVRILLAALLAAEGRAVSADSLLDTLWGDAPTGDPYGTLSGKVTQLRRALDSAELGARELVESQRPGYRLRLCPDDLDLRRFRDKVERSRTTKDAGERVALLSDALALWRGPAFADVAELPFARPVVTRLAEERLVAQEEYAEARLAVSEEAAMVGELAELVAENPLRERLRAAHVLALYRAGRQSEALESYAALRAHLADELGLDPSPELVALQRAVLAHDPLLDSPPAAGPPRTNLPAAVDDLVGRDDAVADIRARLAGDRLVTLVGPGGVGKTRLALQVASGLPDAWLVELAGLAFASAATPADVVGATLGLRDGLFEALRSRRTLLVLDNCEHVVDRAAPFVGRLLRECPGVHILATSRAPLAVAGEVVRDVLPLDLPDAVRLLLKRVSAASPDFVLDGDNAEAVNEICRRLDGIPLALELAANRVRTLGVHALARRLDDRFRLLDIGHRDAPRASGPWPR